MISSKALGEVSLDSKGSGQRDRPVPARQHLILAADQGQLGIWSPSPFLNRNSNWASSCTYFTISHLLGAESLGPAFWVESASDNIRISRRACTSPGDRLEFNLQVGTRCDLARVPWREGARLHACEKGWNNYSAILGTDRGKNCLAGHKLSSSSFQAQRYAESCLCSPVWPHDRVAAVGKQA